MKRIYLDNAATTPLDKRVAKAMWDFEMEFFGNPSSTHREGQNTRAKIDFAREGIAKFINAKPQEIIFTSGATEANNHVIRGVVSHALFSQQVPGGKPHVITTLLEHQSVYNTVKLMEGWGVIDATYLKPSKDGIIDPEDVVRAITGKTILVSAIFVSNEIGTIINIREIGKLLADVNARLKSKILFHTDAVQAVKYFNCNVEKLGLDLMTVSAHKVNGPKGIGALYIKSGVRPDNLLSGGSQEYGKRPGTQNTSGIIGFAKAVELLGTLEDRQKNAENISKLRDKLISGISEIEKVELNGPTGDDRTADNVNFTIYDVDQDALMTALDLAGISASTGSACVSGSSEPSHVIDALGKIHNGQAATIRFTLSKDTTEKEIDYTIKTLVKLIGQLRK